MHAEHTTHPGGVLFERIILGAIFANTVVMIVSFTVEGTEELLEPVHTAFLLLFAAEMIIRLRAVGWDVKEFLTTSKWNGFDALVVAVAVLPAFGLDAGILQAARAARVFHTLRHVSHLRLVVRLGDAYRKLRLLLRRHG